MIPAHCLHNPTLSLSLLRTFLVDDPGTGTDTCTEEETMAKEIMTIEEAANYLQIGRRSLYKLAKEGRIPGKKVMSRWRFEKESLKRWVSGSVAMEDE